MSKTTQYFKTTLVWKVTFLSTRTLHNRCLLLFLFLLSEKNIPISLDINKSPTWSSVLIKTVLMFLYQFSKFVSPSSYPMCEWGDITQVLFRQICCFNCNYLQILFASSYPLLAEGLKFVIRFFLRFQIKERSPSEAAPLLFSTVFATRTAIRTLPRVQAAPSTPLFLSLAPL